MPFPWKKNRVPRISQFVADLQSPKRGGSLVVETGFPTSLIDLFVKNRNRFKKNRSKKYPPPNIPDPPPPSPATPPSPHVPTVLTPKIEQNDDRVTECGHGFAVNGVILVKILMVLALVASVKRITVGITVSAFALLLLEYAGKRVVLCSVVESWFQKVVKRERAGEFGNELTQLSSQCLSIDEIEIVEMIDVGVCGDVAPELLLEDCCSSKPCPIEDEIFESKIRGSRSGRFRSKMVKKLVPKKFRGCKKEKKGKQHNEGESGSEVSSVVEEDKLPIIEIEQEEQEFGVKLSNTVEVDCGINNEKRVEKIGNLGSSMVLVMIALVGLLVGRFPALIFLMTWCCSVKVFKTIWRSHNVPLIKCFVSNS